MPNEAADAETGATNSADWIFSKLAAGKPDEQAESEILDHIGISSGKRTEGAAMPRPPGTTPTQPLILEIGSASSASRTCGFRTARKWVTR
jgi:hypothetical protein